MVEGEHTEHKPTIETMINSTALALTAFGAVTLTKEVASWETLIKGIVLITFGTGLEYFKYHGRKHKYW